MWRRICETLRRRRSCLCPLGPDLVGGAGLVKALIKHKQPGLDLVEQSLVVVVAGGDRKVGR